MVQTRDNNADNNADNNTTDNSNDRSYINAEKEYKSYREKQSIVNIEYLKSGIYFNNDIQNGIMKFR